MITAMLDGGMAARMFQVATAYAVALDNNDECAFNFSMGSMSQDHPVLTYRHNIFHKLKDLPTDWAWRAYYTEKRYDYDPIVYFKDMILRDWMLAGIGKVMSGAYYTETYGDDRWGTGQNDARPDRRNNHQGETFYRIDFRLSRSFSIRSMQLEFIVDIINAFNIKNYTGYYGAQSAGDLFMQPYAAAPGRQFQIALYFRF